MKVKGKKDAITCALPCKAWVVCHFISLFDVPCSSFKQPNSLNWKVAEQEALQSPELKREFNWDKILFVA